MFSDDYKKELENIKPNGYIKQKVLKKIEEKEAKKEEKQNLKPPKIKILYKTVSVAAALALIVGGMSLLKFIKPKTNVELSVKPANSYEDIYEAISQYEKEYVYLIEDEAVDMEAAEDDGLALKGDAVDVGTAPTKPNENTNTNGSNETYGENNDHTQTNNQVSNVEEADVIKTDGKYIYYFWANSNRFKIIEVGNTPKLVCDMSLEDADGEDSKYEKHGFYDEMYLSGNKLIFFATVNQNDGESFTNAYVYDISDKTKPKKVYDLNQSGTYNTSRLIGNKLYLLSNYHIYLNNIEENNPETYVPFVSDNNTSELLKADCISIGNLKYNISYNVISAFNINDGSIVSSQAILGGAQHLYCSTENIIITDYSYNSITPIVRYSLNDGVIKFECEGEIKGNLLNQFSIDEHNGYFRFVTTYTEKNEYKDSNYSSVRMENRNALYVLNDKLEKVGEVTDLAPDERVYSVRFMGNTAYFVTFRQVDPLFSVDLTDPANPKVIGKLKIPGFSNYLFPFGEGKLLGIGQDADEKSGVVDGVKLSMFDISDPANVTESQKFVLKENYSPALSNHKASLVDYNKGLIGFAVYGNRGVEYKVFKFSDNGFENVLSVDTEGFGKDVRGIRIGDELYIVGEYKLWVYSLKDFTPICDIKI